MNRIDIINSLITKHKYKSYVELGVQAGNCFSAINCEEKIGVDPDQSSAATLKITSDEFFANNERSYDIFFVDSLHHAEDCERDILNALKFLNPGGTIVCHDMLPTNKHMQEIPLTDQNEWCGNVWRSFLKFRTERTDLILRVVDTDWGCGIITRGNSNSVLNIGKPLSEVTYEEFAQNKKDWMNVISDSEFIKHYLV